MAFQFTHSVSCWQLQLAMRSVWLTSGVCYSSIGYAATDVNQASLTSYVPQPQLRRGGTSTPGSSSTLDPLQCYINRARLSQAATVCTAQTLVTVCPNVQETLTNSSDMIQAKVHTQLSTTLTLCTQSLIINTVHRYLVYVSTETLKVLLPLMIITCSMLFEICISFISLLSQHTYNKEHQHKHRVKTPRKGTTKYDAMITYRTVRIQCTTFNFNSCMNIYFLSHMNWQLNLWDTKAVNLTDGIKKRGSKTLEKVGWIKKTMPIIIAASLLQREGDHIFFAGTIGVTHDCHLLYSNYWYFEWFIKGNSGK